MEHLNNKLIIIGRREWINFPTLNIVNIEAKIDTGAYTCAVHCKQIELVSINGSTSLNVKFLDGSNHNFEEFTRKKIKNSSGNMEERYVIKTIIQIGKKKIITTISLTDRENMRYPVLIGRRFLKNKFIVDVSLIYTNSLKNKLKKN